MLVFALLSAVALSKATWESHLTRGSSECNVGAVLDGADFFVTTYRLLEQAGQGSEVVLFGWEVYLDAQLLGYRPPKDGRFPTHGPLHTLENTLVRAANRGATIFIQLWMTKGSAGFMPAKDQTKEAARLEGLKHPNIRIFLDNGRHRVMYPKTWVNLMRAVVFDRKLALISSFDFVHPAFGSNHFAPQESVRASIPVANASAEWAYGIEVPQRSFRDFGLKVRGAVAENLAIMASEREATYCDNLAWPSKHPHCEKRLPLSFEPPASYKSPYEREDGLLRWGSQCRLSINGGWEILGVANTTTQVTEDYAGAIRDAERYVYIENQYFISRGFGERASFFHASPQNDLAQVLAARLGKAIAACSSFSAVIVVPLAPKESTILYHTWRTLFHEKVGLVPKLQEELRASTCTKAIEDFISVHWMGAARRLPNSDHVFYSVVTHAKFLMADDFITAGSTNWNDRSFLGKDASINLAVDGIAHIRPKVFEAVLSSPERAMAACSGDGSGPSLARVFHEDAAANDAMVKEYVGLDPEYARDLLTGRRLLDTSKKDECSHFANGRRWAQRRARVPEPRARYSGLLPYAGAAYTDAAKLKAWWDNTHNF